MQHLYTFYFSTKTTTSIISLFCVEKTLYRGKTQVAYNCNFGWT